MFKGIMGSFAARRHRAQLSEIRRWLLPYKGGNVTLEKDEETGIAKICLDQPGKRNAFSGFMMTALEDAVQSLESWETGKGVLVYGAGHNFCSGGDLDFVKQTATMENGFRISTYMQNVLSRLQDLPLVSVALVEGIGALGGGAEVALACDFRLVTNDTAGIGFVHRNMGIAPPWGGAARLVHSIGYSAALELMTSARLVSGTESVNLGLVHGCIHSEDPVAAAVAWLQKRTKGHPQVVRTIKMMAMNVRGSSIKDALPKERELCAPLWGGPANLEALSKNIKHRL